MIVLIPARLANQLHNCGFVRVRSKSHNILSR